MEKIEALENLRELGHEWKGVVKKLIEEENYGYLKTERSGKNFTDKYRISILPRTTYPTGGFWEKGQGKPIIPSRNQIIYKVAGYVQGGDFKLGLSPDEFQGIIKVFAGNLVRESLDSNLNELEKVSHEIAEKYRNKYFGKDFLNEILNETNNFIGSLKN